MIRKNEKSGRTGETLISSFHRLYSKVLQTKTLPVSFSATADIVKPSSPQGKSSQIKVNAFLNSRPMLNTFMVQATASSWRSSEKRKSIFSRRLFKIDTGVAPAKPSPA